MIRDTAAAPHACGCSDKKPARRLGDAASDIASYQPGGINYTPPAPGDTYTPGTPISYTLDMTPEELAALTQAANHQAAAMQPAASPRASAATNWPLIAAAGTGTLLLITLLQPGGRRR